MNELEEDPFAAEPDNNENDAATLRRLQQLLQRSIKRKAFLLLFPIYETKSTSF